MKLGFGLYRHMLDDDHLRFAKQCGATHIIVHLCDYFNKSKQVESNDQPIGDEYGWGIAQKEEWSLPFLQAINNKIQQHGLIWHGVENFSPSAWDHVLFGGPKRDQQIKELQNIIRNLGEIGIAVMGYNFSLTGVTGRIIRHDARGGAQTVGMEGSNNILEAPLPNSMAWNMVVDPAAKGYRPAMSEETLWENLAYFLQHILPVAEEAGVIMAAHPDDPPVDMVRGLPKLVNQHAKYQHLIDINPNTSNQLELCVGTLAEMSEGDVYQAVEYYAKQQRIGYVHLRNVKGKVPHYKETFIDDGDVDIGRILAILKEHNFDSVIIPDHSPQMTCPAPWHAGMAFAMGYIKAELDRLHKQ